MELQTVPVGKLRANPFNPRRTFEPTGDEDLSIKEMATQMKHDGVLQPLLVRPMDGGLAMEQLRLILPVKSRWANAPSAAPMFTRMQ